MLMSANHIAGHIFCCEDISKVAICTDYVKLSK